MASVSTYLNFDGQTEEAFNFYKDVFGTEFEGEINRMGDHPPMPGTPELSDDEKRRVMHVSLPTLGDHRLMGTDIVESVGMSMTVGDNVSIMLHPDTREELDRLFAALAVGGTVFAEPRIEFWGDYFASLEDRFGIRWMFNVPSRDS